MSFLRNDLKYGLPSYAAVGKWNETQVPSQQLDITCIDTLISTALERAGVDTIFDHIYFNYESTQSDGTITTSVADVGFDTDDLVADFVNLYEARPVCQPFYDNETGLTKSYTKLQNLAETTLRLNKAKYIKLMETLGYTYSPIENYDMIEISGDAEKEAPREDNKSIRGDKVRTETAPELKTNNYTTTFDNDTPHLETQTIAEYNGIYPVDPDTNVPIKQIKEFYTGTNPGETSTLTHTGQVALTIDTITTPSSDKANVHKLVRHGRMGGNPIELIEAQRNLVKFSLEQEILTDLEKALLLSCYN